MSCFLESPLPVSSSCWRTWRPACSHCSAVTCCRIGSAAAFQLRAYSFRVDVGELALGGDARSRADPAL